MTKCPYYMALIRSSQEHVRSSFGVIIKILSNQAYMYMYVSIRVSCQRK